VESQQPIVQITMDFVFARGSLVRITRAHRSSDRQYAKGTNREQASGKAADKRSDPWARTALLWS